MKLRLLKNLLPILIYAYFVGLDAPLLLAAEAEVSSDVDRYISGLQTAQSNRQRWAVIIGIEKYQRTVGAPFARRDAQSVKEYAQKLLEVPQENIFLLLDEEATKTTLQVLLEERLPRRLKPGDEVFVYYAGHGLADPRTGQPYLLPSDTDPQSIQLSGYSAEAFYGALVRLKGQRVVVFLDACFSGVVGRQQQAQPLLPGARPLVLTVEDPAVRHGNLTVLAAAQHGQFCNSDPESGHGLFTYHLLRGLVGEADSNGDGRVGLVELASYVKDAVDRKARELYGQTRYQTPVLTPAKLEAGQDIKLTDRTGKAPPAEPAVATQPRAYAQDRRSLSAMDVEDLLRAGVSRRRVAELIEDGGVNFTLTEEVRQKLKKVGADAGLMQADARLMQAVEKAAAEYAKVKPEVIKGKDGAEMVLVPVGEFWMGSEDSDAYADEKPRRRVYLDAFYIDKYEVTNALYQRFIEVTGRAAPKYWNDISLNQSNQPVVGVTWDDANAYCEWAGKRLPTEAEWEKAARGMDGRKYPWGNQWDSNRANSNESKVRRTVPVGSYPNGVSAYGVHDMAGNVWEWVADWYDRDYYQRAPDRNLKGPDSGQMRVLRGGWWDSRPRNLRASSRSWIGPDSWTDYIGFRCAEDVPLLQQEEKPPYLAFNVLLRDEDGDNILEGGGEKMTLQVTVRNERAKEGKPAGIAKGVQVAIESKGEVSGLRFPHLLEIGDLSPGQEKTVTGTFTADANVREGKVSFVVKVVEANGFDADPKEVVFNVKPFYKPELRVGQRWVDAGANQQIDLGEEVTLSLIIQNDGRGRANNVKAQLSLPSAEVRATDSAERALGDLSPGDRKEIKFSFVVTKRFTGKEIPLEVKLREDRAKAEATEKITLPIRAYLPPPPVIALEPKPREREPELKLSELQAASDVDEYILKLPEKVRTDKNKWALVIGIERYSRATAVPFARNDVLAVREYMHKVLGVPRENTFLLQDDEATLGQIKVVLEDKLPRLLAGTKGASVYVYYAGHGVPEVKDGTPYLLPADGDPQSPRVSGYSTKDFYAALGKLDAERVLVFLDACFNGLSARQSQPQMLLAGARQLYWAEDVGLLPPKVVLLAAAQNDQVSNAYGEQSHGLFTYFLLKGLSGAAEKSKDGAVFLSGLADYVKEEVSRTSRQLFGQNMHQTPVVRPILDPSRDMVLRGK